MEVIFMSENNPLIFSDSVISLFALTCEKLHWLLLTSSLSLLQLLLLLLQNKSIIPFPRNLGEDTTQICNVQYLVTTLIVPKFPEYPA